MHVLCAIRPTAKLATHLFPGVSVIYMNRRKCWYFFLLSMCIALPFKCKNCEILLVVLHRFWWPLVNRSTQWLNINTLYSCSESLIFFLFFQQWQWIIYMFSFNLFTLCRKCNKKYLSTPGEESKIFSHKKWIE